MTTIENSMTEALPATLDPREALLNLISNSLERIHGTPLSRLVDYSQEALDLLEQVEAWSVEYNPAGSLELRDPAADIAGNEVV